MKLLKRINQLLRTNSLYTDTAEYYGYLVDNFNSYSIFQSNTIDAISDIPQYYSLNSISIHSFNKSTTIKHVRKILGKEKAFFQNTDYEKKYTILFFNIKLYKYSAIMQLHFLNDLLFFGKYLIQDSSAMVTESIKKMISAKYDTNIQEERMVIKDAAGSLIYLHNEAALEIDYFINNSVIDFLRDQRFHRLNQIENSKKALLMKSISKF